MTISSTKCLRIAPAIALGMMALPSGIGAADDKAGLPPMLEKLRSCQVIAIDAARLACFDHETEVLVTAAKKGEVRVVDKEQATAMRKSLFGFQLPHIGIFGDKDDKAEQAIDQVLTSTIVRVQPLAEGKFRITIAEGKAVWETTDRRSGMRAPKTGDKVEFEKAALGTYWIRIDGQMGVKGRRVS